MNLGRFTALWPFCFISCLTIVVLVPPLSGIIFWNSTMNHIGAELDSNSATFNSVMMSKVNQTAETLMSDLCPTATNLARTCTSFVKPNLSFSDLETKMAPVLFQAKSLVPLLSEVSFIGVDGLFFSYFIEDNQTYSLYSNSSLSSNQTWYKQLVDPITGNPKGDAVKYRPLLTTNESWFREAFKSGEFAVLEQGWNQNRDLMLLRTARVGGLGLVSLGFGVQGLVGMFSNVNLLQYGSLFLVSGDGTVLLSGFRDTQLSLSGSSVLVRVVGPRGEVVQTANVSCSMNGETARAAASITYQEEQYKLFCSPVEILGIQSVYILAVVDNPMGRIHKKMEEVRVFLVVLIVALLLAIMGSIFVTMRAARREMHLCAKLIDQMEATRQAETKSMSKSTAFASASHDIRASLAGIIGLIDISYGDVLPGSDLEKNLNLMDGSAKDLLELLNSVLDTSKIEVGKMLLEDEEFNLAQLVEDVVDSYHAVATKKNVDLILDPCDGSIIRNSMVRGDKLKLRQILSNLLSNAVKFTPEGHISVRAWARKPSLEASIIVDNQRGWRRRFAGLLFRGSGKNINKEEEKEMKVFERNPKAMEFAFEVDDTGKGIPKEKQKLVFENYIQVKETSHGLGGTGLGLGIVQSLVRLMGGDIKIMDKEIGEKGTCFRFNVFLELSTDNDVTDETREDDLKQRCHSMRLPGLTIRRTNSGQSSGSSSRFLSPRSEGSTIVLLIQDEERRRVSQAFMERLGIKVMIAKEVDEFRSILRNMKRKLNHSRDSSSGKSDDRSSAKDLPLSSMDGSDQILPVFRRPKGVVLLVIDTSSGPFQQLLKLVSQFRKGLQTDRCRVVWLDKASSRVITRGVLNEGKLDRSDIVMSQPFHGSRLFEAIKILPEFAGSGSKKRRESGEIREAPPSCLPEQGRKNEIVDVPGSSSDKPLSGKRVLLAEDNEVLALTTRTILMQLGATFERCRHGEEAVGLVMEGLRQGQVGGPMPPYDFILMDCEMPVMDGFDATRRIREAEKECNLHIPIIALTAHSLGDETRKMYAAGMDFHLEKPLKKDSLLEVLIDWKVV